MSNWHKGGSNIGPSEKEIEAGTPNEINCVYYDFCNGFVHTYNGTVLFHIFLTAKLPD